MQNLKVTISDALPLEVASLVIYSRLSSRALEARDTQSDQSVNAWPTYWRLDTFFWSILAGGDFVPPYCQSLGRPGHFGVAARSAD